MLQYLYGHITYPQYAKDHGIEGRCVVTFVVETDGSISEAKILKDIGGGCGEASLNIVNSMNQMPQRWIPGTQRAKQFGSDLICRFPLNSSRLRKRRLNKYLLPNFIGQVPLYCQVGFLIFHGQVDSI